MKKWINRFAWIFLLKALIGSICLLGYDLYQTQQALSQAEVRIDNTTYLNGILAAQNKVLKGKCK